MWSLNLSVYSMALIPRNNRPRNIVYPRYVICVLTGWLVCAARTASAIVSELMIRIAVFAAPQ